MHVARVSRRDQPRASPRLAWLFCHQFVEPGYELRCDSMHARRARRQEFAVKEEWSGHYLIALRYDNPAMTKRHDGAVLL